MDATAINVVEAGRPLQAKIVIRNFGQTPAYRFETNVMIGFFREPLYGPFRLNGQRFVGASKTIAWPNQKIEGIVSGTRDVTVEEIRSLESGEAAVYVFGEIRFADVSNQNWRVLFRFVHNRDNFMNEIATLSACSEGNEEIRG